MGAWGPGVFENDDAADWTCEFQDEGLTAIDRACSAVAEPRDEHLEAPEASRALVAAETVARGLACGLVASIDPSAVGSPSRQ